MSGAKRAVRAMIAALLVVAGLVAIAPAAASTAAVGDRPSQWCRSAAPGQLAFAGGSSNPPDTDPNGAAIVGADAAGTYVPIIVVHGVLGTSVWGTGRDGAFSHLISKTANAFGDVTARTSLIGQFQDLPNAAVFTFDYKDWNTRWVTDDHIAAALGSAVDCLAKASGQKVILVTHSMGGLAARLALGRPTASGGRPGAEVSTVVDFGTPEDGSIVGSVANGMLSAVKGPLTADAEQFLLTALADCPPDSNGGNFCRLAKMLADLDPTTAATGLAYLSPAVMGLPKYPSTVHVVSLAGQITYDQTVGGSWLFAPASTTRTSLGDSIVPTSSALDAAGEHDTLRCNYTLNGLEAGTNSFLVGLGLKSRGEVRKFTASGLLGFSPCSHGQLLDTIELTNDALGAVNDDISSRHLTFDPFTMQVPAMCTQGGGRLATGIFPTSREPSSVERTTPLDWIYTTAGTAEQGDGRSATATATQPASDSDEGVAAVTAVGCDAGGADTWPDHIVFSKTNGDLLASFDLASLSSAEHANVTAVSLHGSTATVSWIGDGPESVDAADTYLGSTATFTYDGSSELKMSGRSNWSPGLQGTVGFGHLGSLTTAMSLKTIGKKLLSDVDTASPIPGCAGTSYATDGNGAHERINQAVGGLAISGGATGHADVISLGGVNTDVLDRLGSLLGLLPKTSSGIGLSSPFSAVEAAYPAAEIEKNYWDAGRSATVKDGNGNAMRFTSDSVGNVVQISVGRLQYITNDDGCG